MSKSVDAPSYEQLMYWRELLQLKADAFYIREYRDSLNKWVKLLAIVRAITSTSSIAGWLIWKQYAFVWAGLLAASQLAEALKNVFPFYKERRSLSRWSNALNRHFVEAQRDWAEIYSGTYTNSEIRKLCHSLRTRKARTEAKYIPEGLKRKNEIVKKAEEEAEAFFRSIYTSSE